MMILMKKIFKCSLITLSLLVFGTSCVYADVSDFTKRIVSVVYDDSWSMSSNGQDYKYANYAMQNIVGFMNESDELHVVRMSDKTKYETIDLSSSNKKTENIEAVRNWRMGADETPFEAVETAVECLKERKLIHGNSSNNEYWLLVLTDGGFEHMPANVEEYFTNFQDYMSDVKCESIFVFIGDKSEGTVKSVAKKLNNTTVIDSSNNDAICEALFKACEKIYGRTSIKGSNVKSSDNTVSFDFEFPISKITVYEQDQSIELREIKSSNGESFNSAVSYVAIKDNEPKLSSKIIEVKDYKRFIEKGNVDLVFDDNVSADISKFQIMVDSAVSLELAAIDSKGNKIENLNSFNNEDIVRFEARPINSYDGSLIDMTNYISKCDATYEQDGSRNKMRFDNSTKTFMFDSTALHVGSNVFSANLELPGFFECNAKVLDIYVSLDITIEPNIDKDRVTVSKNLNKDYERVDSITYKLNNIKEKVRGTLEFSSIPKGIQLKVNGTTVKKNKIKLTFNENNIIDIYRNNTYTESDSQDIYINVEFDDKNIKIKDKGNSFIVEPLIRVVSIKTEELFDDKNSLNAGNAYGKNLYKIIPLVDNENMSKDELKNCKISFKNNGDNAKFGYKIENDNKENVINLYLKNSLNPLSKLTNKNIDVDFELTTKFGEVVRQNLSFYVKSNLIATILSILIPLIILWYIIGLFKKDRFEVSEHQFIVLKDGKEIHRDKIIKTGSFINFFIPYKAEEGLAYDLHVKAGSSKSHIIIMKKSLKEEMKYDNDEVDTKKDLKLYEEVQLILLGKEGGKKTKTVYLYSDVVSNLESENTASRTSGRRRGLSS